MAGWTSPSEPEFGDHQREKGIRNISWLLIVREGRCLVKPPRTAAPAVLLTQLALTRAPIMMGTSRAVFHKLSTNQSPCNKARAVTGCALSVNRVVLAAPQLAHNHTQMRNGRQRSAAVISSLERAI
jgi:hypothetical protein